MIDRGTLDCCDVDLDASKVAVDWCFLGLRKVARIVLDFLFCPLLCCQRLCRCLLERLDSLDLGSLAIGWCYADRRRGRDFSFRRLQGDGQVDSTWWIISCFFVLLLADRPVDLVTLLLSV